MAARLWVIWSARNDMLWNDKVWSLEDLRRAVESFLHDWKLAFSPSENMSQVHSVASPAVWHPPPEGWVKCNIDASLPAVNATPGLRRYPPFKPTCNNEFKELIIIILVRVRGCVRSYATSYAMVFWSFAHPTHVIVLVDSSLIEFASWIMDNISDMNNRMDAIELEDDITSVSRSQFSEEIVQAFVVFVNASSSATTAAMKLSLLNIESSSNNDVA
nr:uncharacterized protein LOC109179342 [Ipomoea batatas]